MKPEVEEPPAYLHINRAHVSLLDDVASRAWMVNVRNGWWADRRNLINSGIQGAKPVVIIGCLGLVTSEVAEAMEAVRKHDPATWGDAETKDTLVRELAGAIIRIMDLSSELGLPLGAAIAAEVSANARRGYMHGGRAA